MTDTNTTAKDTSEEDGKNTKAKVEGEGTDTSKNQDAPKFTQADLDRIAAKTREEERAKAKAAKEKEDRERAERDDEQQKKFEKLAADRKARIDEIEPELEKYKAKTAELAVSELEALPDEVRDIAPAQYAEDKSLANPLEVLAWLPKGKALAEKLEGQSAKPGAGKDPKAANLTPTELVANERQRLQRTGKYAL